MSNRERCADCAHFTEQSTCDFPTPFWVGDSNYILNPHIENLCPTFSQKMEVIEIDVQ